MDSDKLKDICAAIKAAEQPVRTLSLVAWDSSVKEEFFRTNEQKLPDPQYPAFDPAESYQILSQIENELTGKEPLHLWLRKAVRSIRTCCQMLEARGTESFYKHSKSLYGHPKSRLHDGISNSLSLAKMWNDTIENRVHSEFYHPAEACHLPEYVQEEIQSAVSAMLSEHAPAVVIDEDMAANASASPKTIKLRKGACFSTKDIKQLIHHEAGVHVTTFVNGAHQDRLPILGSAYAGTTRTQEGLAVFSELITGSIDIARMRRLVDRVHAIQMAIDGADFIQVYRFFLDQNGGYKDDAFEYTRRVFRGGVLQGGAPFTKDVVYLDGLLRVHNFLRSVVSAGRLDCLHLMFCGKIDLEDIPILCHLAADGYIRAPKYLPKWVADPDFLITYLTYSSFLSRVDFKKINEKYTGMMAAAPVCKFVREPSV